MIVIAPAFLKFATRIFHGKEIASTARAMAIFPFIIIRSKEDATPWLINHEKIHFRQELEGLFIFHLLLNLMERFYGRYVLKLSLMETYLRQSAEQEAYLNQNNPNYLKSRTLFNQWQYVFNKKKFELDKNEPGKVVLKS